MDIKISGFLLDDGEVQMKEFMKTNWCKYKFG